MSIRLERIGNLIRDDISQMILHGEIKDRRLGLVTISDVSITRDLRNAKVSVSYHGSETEGDIQVEVLNNAKGFIRRLLAKKLQIRTVPALQFVLDRTMLYQMRIESLLREVPNYSEIKEQSKEQSNEEK